MPKVPVSYGNNGNRRFSPPLAPASTYPHPFIMSILKEKPLNFSGHWHNLLDL